MHTSGHQQAIGDAEAPQTLTFFGKKKKQEKVQDRHA